MACKHEWIEDGPMVCSSPPEYHYICRLCGSKRVIEGKTPPVKVYTDPELATLTTSLGTLQTTKEG